MSGANAGLDPEWADKARRLSDLVTMHVLAHTPPEGGFPDWNGPAPWVFARFSDGGTDGNLYPSKKAAVEHQLHRDQGVAFTIPPTGMTALEAQTVLKFNAQMKANGIDIADPDMQIRPHMLVEDRAAALRNARMTSGR